MATALAQREEWELGNRRWIREKVIALYERLFDSAAPAGAYAPLPEEFWRELLLLKVNRLWLFQRVVAMSEEDILGGTKPLFRDILLRCRVALHSDDELHAAHALEMLSAMLSGLGMKSFADPGSDTLEVFCGIQQVDPVMRDLLGSLVRFLRSDHMERRAGALQCLLTLATLTTNINQNILTEFMMAEDVVREVFGILHAAEPGSEVLCEQALKLSVLMSCYQKYESSNAYLRVLRGAQTVPQLHALLQPAVRKLSECTAVCIEGPAATELTVTGAVVWALQRGLEVLTLDELMGERRVTIDSALQISTRSAMYAALLTAYEAVTGNPALVAQAFYSAAGQADVSALGNGHARAKPAEARSAAGGAGAGANGKPALANGDASPQRAADAPAAPAGSIAEPLSDRATVHCAALRHVLTLASLVSLEVKRPAAVSEAHLCMLTLLAAASTQQAVRVMHASNLGGNLEIWRVERTTPVARRTARNATLASAIYEVVTLMLSQNIRNRAVPTDAFQAALLLTQRLMGWEQQTSTKLADVPWQQLWMAVVSSLLHIAPLLEEAEGEARSTLNALCHRHLLVMNMVLVHGASFLPQAALQQQFAYEVVRLHVDFEKLFDVGKRCDPSGRLKKALALVQRIIVMTLERLDGPSHSQSQVMSALQELQLEVEPQMAASLHKWQLPPENPTHVSFFQAVSRQLISGYRTDGTLELAGGAAQG